MSRRTVKKNIDNSGADFDENDMDYILYQQSRYRNGHNDIEGDRVTGLRRLAYEREPDVWELE